MKNKKIRIIGTSGSGKTFLAKNLSKKLKLPHYDLDDIYWIKKFTKKTSKKLRKEKADKLANKKKWIIEGIFGSWTINSLKKADLVIWLKTSSIKRVIRILKRNLKNEKENETIKDAIKLAKYSLKYRFGKGSQSHSAHKELFNKYKINYITLKSNKQITKFLENIK